jgi:hypothetical protein
MKFNRPLTAVLYCVAGLMIIVPTVEVVLSVWPLRMGVTSWRFGTLGLLSQAIMTPLLGFVVLIATAFALGHRRALTATAVLTGLLALLLLVALPFFALDAIQMRVQVRREALRAFDLSAVLASIKLFASFIVMVLAAVGTVKALKRSTARRSTAAAEGPLIASPRT